MPRPRPAPERDERWALLLAAQHGIVNVAQLRQFGISPDRCAAHVAARRWRGVLPRVYATFTGPLLPDALISAALLYGGPAAILSHRTAAERWGLLPTSSGPVHLTVPYRHSAVSQAPLVVVHRSRAHRHIVVATDPPMTSSADTAIDVSVAEPTARAARQMLTTILATGRVRPATVRRRLVERPPLRYHKALAEALRLVSDGVLSVLEERYAVDVEQRHGLPAARRQAPVIVDGRTLYEDVVYDEAGAPLTVRLDGRMHLIDEIAFRDRRRDNAAELAGRARLVFGWQEVSGDACGVAAEVAAVLYRIGWIGVLRPCSRCSGGAVSA
ncbi:hypothetical protein ACFQE5_18600 [Pseudonocardia hispaniensis]|uniref:Transcriptional regulator, AbiEi antitoxin, Type IV TA system n=1 Tax=Pseudonocardia hispaniensis TaxID=904933 RepID=A0ABW1J6R9_9PSEU